MTQLTLDYFEEYRNKVKELSVVSKELEQIERSLAKKRNEIMQCQQDIVAMRHIITMMIETGMDPVEIKLSTDPLERSKSMWNDYMFEDNYSHKATVTTTGLVATGTTIPLNGLLVTSGSTGSMTQQFQRLFQE